MQPFMRLTIVLALVLIIGWGCAQEAAIAPSPEPHEKESASSSPQVSVPSKGTGLKRKAPVTVKGDDRLGWVDNALQTYPPERFLTGLGIAPDRKTASRRSISEMEKPITQAISGRINLRSKELQTLSRQLDQNFDKLADACLRASLATATTDGRVAELFIEKATLETVYALAVLDRQLSANQLKRSIQGLDDQLKRLLNRLSDPNHLVQAADRGELAGAFICREALDAALTMVNPEGQGIPLSVKSEVIDRLLEKK